MGFTLHVRHGAADAADDAQQWQPQFVSLLVQGPFFKWAYSWLDRSFGAQATLQKVCCIKVQQWFVCSHAVQDMLLKSCTLMVMQAVIKTAVGQVTVFPVYLSALLVYMNALENKSFKGAEQKLRNSFLPIYTSGWSLCQVRA